jgi:hypothetical protein
VTTNTVSGFYVPAAGTATYELFANSLASSKAKDPTPSSIQSVTVTVTRVRSYDENWKELIFPADGPATVVMAPAVPR